MNFKANMIKTSATVHLRRLILFAISLLLFSNAIDVQVSAFGKTQHPYILWTSEEAAGLRKTYETNDWAKQQLAKLSKEDKGKTFVNLYRYQVLGDEKAGDEERKYLLSFIDAKLDESGRSSHGVGRHYDNYAHALRYDVLYNTLTPIQRKDIETTFRRFIQYELDNPYHNTKISLLPNMQLPRMLAAHMMSVAIGDEKLIREIWAAPSGFKWYFDEYLSDGGLYNEEFGKMTSLIGEMLLYCRGLDRLGLSELGYGFTGKSGASMRSYVESLLWIGYPQTKIPGGMPRYERVTMGDARRNLLGIFQHCNVQGQLISSHENQVIKEWDYFYGANMNGRDHRNRKVGKLQFPQWFEILHAKYPDGPFGYFLVQMRRKDSAEYIPTPFWGLEPIKPKDVKPPEAKSTVYPERGFAMLRADESDDYWESAAPAVAMQFATLYVHYTSDCFSLLGYHAFNRPIYINRTISDGYNGGPWDFSVLGHCGVMVDSEQAQPIGRVPVRSNFSNLVKFVSARGIPAPGAEPYKGHGEVRSSDQPREPYTDIYSNIDLSRSLFLTNEYLFDIHRIADKSGAERLYHWLIHSPGILQDKEKWHDSNELQKTLLNIKPIPAEQQPRKRYWEACDNPMDSWIIIKGEKKRYFKGADIDISILQDSALEDVNKSLLGKEWYNKGIGVRIRMLGQDRTEAYVFDTPAAYRPGTHRSPRKGRSHSIPETGGVSVAIARRSPNTVFAALHEPFENSTSRIEEFRCIQQTKEGIAVAVKGKPGSNVNDRIMYRFWDDHDQSLTLSDNSELFTFSDHVYLRIGTDQVEVSGELKAMRLEVTGKPKLILNGRKENVTYENGYMVFNIP